jgi:hypothetical protein
MLFMVIETFDGDDMLPTYRRLEHSGRQLPDGLRYVDSWVEPSFARCFQLMETDSALTLQAWVLAWRGTGTRFEIVPVVPAAQTRTLVGPHLADR